MKGFTTAAALAGILMFGAATAGTMSSDSTMSDDGMAHSMHHKDAMASKSSMSHGTMTGPSHANAMSSDHMMGHNMQHSAMQASHGTMSGPGHMAAMDSSHMAGHMDKKTGQKNGQMKHNAMSGSSMSHSDNMMSKPN